MRTTTDLISHISMAVDNATKNLTPELRTQCDTIYTRVEALAAIAARIDAGVDAASILAQSRAIQNAVNVSLLLAEYVPTDTEHATICEYVAKEAITTAKRAAQRK